MNVAFEVRLPSAAASPVPDSAPEPPYRSNLALLVSDYVEGLPWKTGRTMSFSRSNCGPSGWIWSLVAGKEVDEWTMDFPAVDASKRCRYWKSFWFPRILVSKLNTLSFHSVTHVLQVQLFALS